MLLRNFLCFWVWTRVVTKRVQWKHSRLHWSTVCMNICLSCLLLVKFSIICHVSVNLRSVIKFLNYWFLAPLELCSCTASVKGHTNISFTVLLVLSEIKKRIKWKDKLEGKPMVTQRNAACGHVKPLCSMCWCTQHFVFLWSFSEFILSLNVALNCCT